LKKYFKPTFAFFFQQTPREKRNSITWVMNAAGLPALA